MVDFEEPRSFGATIKWPAGWAMQHPAYQLRRIPPTFMCVVQVRILDDAQEGPRMA
jgi:hypothetical protein